MLIPCPKGHVGSNPTPRALHKGLYANFMGDGRKNEIRSRDRMAADKTSLDTRFQVVKSPKDAQLATVEQVTSDIGAHHTDRLIDIMSHGGAANVEIICRYLLAEQNEINIKPSTKEGKLKCLIRLSDFHRHKSYTAMTKADVLAYLNSFRKSIADDPVQRWIGTYNGRQMILTKFFRWLYNQEEPDFKKRITPPCMSGVRQLPRKEKSPYKPSDLWTMHEQAVFLKYCPSKRDRCYHAMAIDTSARPHELLNLKISDVAFKKTDDGTAYAEILIQGGKTQPRTLPLIDSIPYLKDWIENGHPTASNPESWLFTSEAHESYGQKLRRDGLWDRYQRYYKKSYFPRLLEDETVPEPDKAIIKNLLTKPFTLYIQRHSALTEKSQLLTESTLRDHAGWTMTSKMPAVYLHYYGTESSKRLLEAKGVLRKDGKIGNELRSKPCPNCDEPNRPGSQFCMKCKMVLSYDSYKGVIAEKLQHAAELQGLRDEMNQKFEFLASLIQQDPRLAQIKPQVLLQKAQPRL